MGKKKMGRGVPIRVEPKLEVEVVKPPPSPARPIVPQPKVAAGSPVVVATSSGSNESLGVDLGGVESQLERLMAKAVDEPSLKAFADAWNERITERLTLREMNVKVSYDEFENLIKSKKLDSNLKKCGAFSKKLRQYTDSQKNSIESDILTLNLTKYLSEIVIAITEARYKVADIDDIVTICSWLHQRYPEFANMLLQNYKKTFPSKKSEFTAAVLSKITVDTRLIGDLVICGVFTFGDGFSFVVATIRNMIMADKEGVQCLIPILSFCQGLGIDFLGEIPQSIDKLGGQYSVQIRRSDVLPVDKKASFRSLVKDYFSSCANHLLMLHRDVQHSEMHNRKLLRSRGEIPVDKKEFHLGVVSKFDKFFVNMVKFSDVLNQNLPELESLPLDPEEEAEKAMLIAETGEQLASVPGIVLFDDEETRSFYQDFTDLKVYLPPVAYRDTVQQVAEQTHAIEEREKALADFDGELEQAELDEGRLLDDDINQEPDSELPPSMRNENIDKEMDKQIKPSYEAFLNQLPNCVNKQMIDKAALEFAENHNTKNNRKKLVNTLFRVPRQRMDLLPIYARLVAILNPVMPDIGLELCQMLKSDFRYLVRTKHQIFIETKIKITRFISELVNFRIFPKSDALQCLKILLLDFVHHQVEMACVFVETCGRFLYRTPDSHRRMKIYLDEIIRKKNVQNMEPRYISMIDHAYFFVIPPEGGLKATKKRNPLDLYLEAVMHEDLNHRTFEFAIDTMLRLNWADRESAQIGIKYLTQPWKLTHNQFSLHAKILFSLSKEEPEIALEALDLILEDVRVGLERCSVLFNHRRMSTVKYIGELYYYRLLGSGPLFGIMYLLVTYGVALDPTSTSPIDPPDNLFRVRLACNLLKDCGEFLSHGSNKKKLKFYLMYLQRYVWFKRSLPIWNTRKFPYGIQELWEDVVAEIFPSFQLAKSYEEALKVVEDLEISIMEKIKPESNEIELKEKGDRKRLASIEESNEDMVEVTETNGSHLPALRCGNEIPTIRPKGLESFKEDYAEFGEDALPSRPHQKNFDSFREDYEYDGDDRPPTVHQEKLDSFREDYEDDGDELSLTPRRDNVDSFGEDYDEYGDYIARPKHIDHRDGLDTYEQATAVKKGSQQTLTPEDEEFIALFDKMCSEVNYGGTRDGGKHMKTDLSIPLHIRNSQSTSHSFHKPSDGSSPTQEENVVPFVMITRKGNKQQYKTLPVPADSEFVQKIKIREEAERVEKESVKKRTLAINELQEAEEAKLAEDAMKATLFKTSNAPAQPTSLSLRNRTRYFSWINRNNPLYHQESEKMLVFSNILDHSYCCND